MTKKAENIEELDRPLWLITSELGIKSYYDHLNYWCVDYNNKNPKIVPTAEEAREYVALLKNHGLTPQGNQRLEVYRERYDWRAQKIEANGNVGLQAPTGEMRLPPLFHDAFCQFSTIESLPEFVPVSNGEGWALSSLSLTPVIMTEFRYGIILPERWAMGWLYFVQDRATGRWGVLRKYYPRLNENASRREWNNRVAGLKEVMPTIADEIYEAELYTDCSPTTFWVARRDGKIGIITSWEATDIIYDSFEADDENIKVVLFINGEKAAEITSF